MAFWDFLKDANKEKEVAGKVFNFLSSAIPGVSQQRAVEKKVEQTRDKVSMLPQTPERDRLLREAQRIVDRPDVATQTRDFTVGAARGIARIPETIARSSVQTGFNLAGGINPDISVPNVSSGDVTDPLRRAIYGNEPVQTYQERTAGNKKALEEGTYLGADVIGGKDVAQKYATPLSLLGFGLTLGGDVINPGGKKGVQEGLQSLAKATTPQQVRQIMKGTPDEIIDKVAPAIAQTRDPNIIDNIIQKAYNPPSAAAVPSPAVTQPLPSLIDATVPRPTAPQPASPDAFGQITDALNGKQGIAAVSAKNKAVLSQERGQRFAASKVAGETAEGSQGYFQELSQLKGEYSKTKLGGMVENLGPEQAEDLFSQARRQIQAVPDSVYDDLGYFPQSARLNTQKAIRKVIFGEGGGVPTASELKLIRLVSPNLADDIASKIPKSRQFFDLVAKLAGLPRALQASLDLSMGGRQGLLVAARHPVLWARANKESVKYLANTKYFDSQMAAIRKTPEYKLGEKYGLATPAANKGAEEAYASADLAYKIPGVGKGVEASQRAYDGGLTKMRSDLWAQTLDAYGGAAKAESDLGEQGMRDLAEAINTLTGRGGKKGGMIDKHVQTLSTTLFAPRLWAARLNTLNPQYYARLSPAARRVALENAGAFAVVASVVLGAAVALGAEVETDARSSDFLKIKVGDTRYDPFGGLQQNMVFAWRQISGEKKSSITGDVTKLGEGFGSPTRLSVASDLVTNKLAPIPGTIGRLLEGKDRGGNEINPAAEIGKLFVPINLQGIYETSKSAGSVPEGVGRNIPNFFGIGTQTYGIGDINLSDKQKSEVQILEQSGAPKEKIQSVKSFYQHLKASPNATATNDKINRALSTGDLTEAQRIADDHNERLSKNLKKWFEANRGQTITKEQAKALNSVIIELDESGIERRLQTISENPVKYGG